MDIKKLEEFLRFMEEHSLCELEIEEEGTRVKLKKFSVEQPIIYSQEIAAGRPAEKPKPEDNKRKEGLIEIKSPMVGTFYRAPAPGAKPFVDNQQDIHPGDVVCIIEAMKLMNEIKAEIGGIIAEILVKNGEPVEFGQPLFLINPS